MCRSLFPSHRLALYVASNTVLNQNKIWSWKEFGFKV